MATAFNLVDYRTVEPVRRPRLRIVEPMIARPAAAAPAASAPAARPKPPAWMIAPQFRSEPAVTVREPQATYRPPAAGTHPGPYRSIREVPRAG